MGIVPEYGAPGNVQGAVQRLEGGRDGFSGEAVRQFERLGIGLEGDEFDVPRLQAGGLDALAVLKVVMNNSSPALATGPSLDVIPPKESFPPRLMNLAVRMLLERV